MPTDLAASPLLVSALALGTLGAILVVAGIAALARARPLRFAVRTLAGLLLLSLGALGAALALGIQGYRALTHEEVAARISVRPVGPQRIAARFAFPDGREQSFEIPGDQILVDAHILKWTPAANLLGLHTAYELDRVTGRYRDLAQERGSPRSVFRLGAERPVDLFGLRKRYAFLSPLLDAEYGSASFVAVDRPAELELRVSTTGLLIREVKPGS
jgi:hypothetical protein